MEFCTYQTAVFLQPCGACETPSICVSALVHLTCWSSITFFISFHPLFFYPIPFATFLPSLLHPLLGPNLFPLHLTTAVSSCLLFDSALMALFLSSSFSTLSILSLPFSPFLCGLQAHIPPRWQAAAGEVWKPALSRLSDLPRWASCLTSKGNE